jgi:hypothetical protein
VIAAFIATCFASSTPAVVERAREYCQRGQRSNSNQHSRAFPARSESVRIKQHSRTGTPRSRSKHARLSINSELSKLSTTVSSAATATTGKFDDPASSQRAITTRSKCLQMVLHPETVQPKAALHGICELIERDAYAFRAASRYQLLSSTERVGVSIQLFEMTTDIRVLRAWRCFRRLGPKNRTCPPCHPFVKRRLRMSSPPNKSDSAGEGCARNGGER